MTQATAASGLDCLVPILDVSPIASNGLGGSARRLHCVVFDGNSSAPGRSALASMAAEDDVPALPQAGSQQHFHFLCLFERHRIEVSVQLWDEPLAVPFHHTRALDAALVVLKPLLGREPGQPRSIPPCRRPLGCGGIRRRPSGDRFGACASRSQHTDTATIRGAADAHGRDPSCAPHVSSARAAKCRSVGTT